MTDSTGPHVLICRPARQLALHHRRVVQSATSLRRMKVVLLHALPLDERAWDDVLPGLHHQVFAPTLYGLGGTIEEWAPGCPPVGEIPIV